MSLTITIQSLLPPQFLKRYSRPMKELIPIDLKNIVEDVKAEGKGRRVLSELN